MPVRLKGFHVINVVPFVDKVMAFMKPFMKKELLDIVRNIQIIFSYYKIINSSFIYIQRI